MKKRYVIGGAIVLAAVIYLLVLLIGNSTSYYLNVSEFYERIEEINDSRVRVAGTVLADSVVWNEVDVELSFTITEGGWSLPVVYDGARPSGFRDDASILVEGKYSSSGFFQASTLILKCSSKYEALLE